MKNCTDQNCKNKHTTRACKARVTKSRDEWFVSLIGQKQLNPNNTNFLVTQIKIIFQCFNYVEAIKRQITANFC